MKITHTAILNGEAVGTRKSNRWHTHAVLTVDPEGAARLWSFHDDQKAAEEERRELQAWIATATPERPCCGLLGHRAVLADDVDARSPLSFF